jgi:hypothetical protein
MTSCTASAKEYVNDFPMHLDRDIVLPIDKYILVPRTTNSIQQASKHIKNKSIGINEGSDIK